jgi:hypothetical protein
MNNSVGGSVAEGGSERSPDADWARTVRLVIGTDKDTFATQLPNQSLAAFADSVARFFRRIAQMFCDHLVAGALRNVLCGNVTA